MFAVVTSLAVSWAGREAAGQWAEWKTTHSKSYGSAAEERTRLAIFLENSAVINKINERTGSTWVAGHNAYSDETWEEFKANRLMAPQNCSATHTPSGWAKPAGTNPPDEVDWRTKIPGWPVKSQGSCGSCWTFSTAGSMEAHHFLKYGQMKNLSEQQLVDCAGGFNNFGCNGGLPSQAFEYLMYNGGQDTEAQYPYTAKTGTTCKYDGEPAAKVAAVVNITALGESELIDAVATEGPVSIAFQVAHDFRFYKSGVYDGVCDTGPADVNHAVVAVGYGAANKSTMAVPYFIVRNSWGAAWGMDGYFNIKRGVNKCGLADCASFPRAA